MRSGSLPRAAAKCSGSTWVRSNVRGTGSVRKSVAGPFIPGPRLLIAGTSSFLMGSVSWARPKDQGKRTLRARKNDKPRILRLDIGRMTCLLRESKNTVAVFPVEGLLLRALQLSFTVESQLQSLPSLNLDGNRR